MWIDTIHCYFKIQRNLEDEAAMSAKSFAVRIFLQDGTIDGLKVVAKSKWAGRGVVIPRRLFSEEKGRAEINAPGVYILIGPSQEEGKQAIFIGRGNPVSAQLEQEFADKGFWTWTLVSTAKKHPLSLVTIQYLEARLLQTAREVSGVDLVNSNFPALPSLPAEEHDAAETFLLHLLSICPILGLTAFEK
jgi:hypothetical protein